MIEVKNIKFEEYPKHKKNFRPSYVHSAKNLETNIRVPATPAQILYYLCRFTEHDLINKKDLCQYIWGRDDYFIRRTFDVHLNKVKKMLRGTDHKIITKRDKLGLFKIDENEQK